VVARLGKLDGAEVTVARGWQDLDALLEGRPPVINGRVKLTH
jgi:hypothetical protein